MTLLLKMSFRNLWRHRTRMVVTLVAVSLSSMLVFVYFALIEGSHTSMLRNLLQSGRYGVIQLYHPEYKDTPTLWHSLTLSPETEQRIRRVPSVVAVAPRIRTGALLSVGPNSVGVGLMALRWAADSTLSPLFVVQGRRPRPGENTLLLSEKVARSLDLAVGDTVVLITQDAYGSLAVDLFAIVGLYRSGNPDADPFLALMDLQTAQTFLAMPDQVTEIALWTTNLMRPQATARRLRQLLGPSVLVLTWQEDHPEIDQYLKLDSGSGWITVDMLLFLVALIVLSTLYMNVVERTREFGVMMALGLRPRWIRGVVLLESLWVGLLGAGLGLVGGLALAGYLSAHPWVWHLEGGGELFGISQVEIYTRILPVHFVYTLLLVLVLSLVGGWLPSRRAASLTPAEALRHV